MSQSICTYGFIPVRNQPSENAGLETQILFGETFEILSTQPRWCRVKCHYDGYEGWIDEKLAGKFADRDVENWKQGEGVIVQKSFTPVVRDDDSTTQLLSAGSRVVFNENARNAFSVGDELFYWQGKPSLAKISPIDVARGFMNAPYLWGGRTFYGVDCSGLVQVAYKAAGIYLPRDASEQIHHGTVVSFVEEAAPGDLAFFDDEEGNIVHVGICLGSGRILHASGSVHIDALDHQGIYHLRRRVYTHHLRVIKRVIHE